MDQNMTISQIADLVQSFGIWILFAWLYITEKRAHEVTRDQYRDDLRRLAGMSGAVITRQPSPPGGAGIE